MSHVHIVFSCGTQRTEFDKKYNAMPADEKEKLERVAMRMWTTLILRYQFMVREHPFMHPLDLWQLRRTELPSLEIYLLFTCLDTVAQPPRKEFPIWLVEQKIDKALGVSEIQELYKEYNRQHGITSNVRKLFANLPPSIIDWMVDNVTVRSLDSEQPEELNQADEIVKQLGEYFYNVRRNPFTHRSISWHTYVAGNIEPPNDRLVLDPLWEFRFNNKHWCMQLSAGIDEATVLRLVIQAVALQKLGIPVLPVIIEAAVTNHSRLSALYGFMAEVESNSRALDWWENFDEAGQGELQTYLISMYIPALSTEWAPIVIERFNPEYPLEQGMRGVVTAYLNEVNQLNSVITEFNTAHLPSKDKWDERRKAIKEFLGRQAKSSYFHFVKHMPSRTETANLWLIIRDPCYT